VAQQTEHSARRYSRAGLSHLDISAEPGTLELKARGNEHEGSCRNLGYHLCDERVCSDRCPKRVKRRQRWRNRRHQWPVSSLEWSGELRFGPVIASMPQSLEVPHLPQKSSHHPYERLPPS